MNLYSYVANNPINELDPLGESTFTGIVSILPFVGTIYNWLSNPAGSHVSDYNIDLSQCNLDIDQAEANCK
jgi:hypothetical protein